jgi:hypothetical protein
MMSPSGTNEMYFPKGGAYSPGCGREISEFDMSG